MASFIKEILYVYSKSYKDEMIAFSMGDKENFYISNDREDSDAIYLSFSYEDWVIIKDFIDNQFKKNNIPF